MALSKINTGSIADDAISLAKMASGTDGNVITYDASGNPAVVATGSDGQVLTSTGSGSPPAFEAVSGGKVLQVVTGSSESSATTTSTTFASTGLTAAITPSATSSKIFVTCSFTGSKNSDDNDADWAYFSIHRGTTDLGGSNGRGIVGHYNYISSSIDNHFPVNMVVLDSPSSTSELTYTVEYAGSGTNDTIAFNNREMKTSIILMEIGA